VVFRKDLTTPHVAPSRRGQAIKQRGKGATEQRVPPGGMESLTGGTPLGRMTRNYPKTPPSGVNVVPPDGTDFGGQT
jgi:hypothetical protein